MIAATQGSASAQQYRAQTEAPRVAPNGGRLPPPGPSLLWPRVELASGLTLVAATLPVAAIVTLAAGPSWLSSCDDDYDDSPGLDACERKEQEERQQGRAAGLVAGLALGAVGLALTIHGGIRIRRTKAERRALARLRPESWSVQPLPQRATATLAWRF
jgi:hypothetical protein